MVGAQGADSKTCRVFWRFDQVRNPNRSGDIPTQSHVRLGVFSENPRKQPDAEELKLAWVTTHLQTVNL